MKNANLSIRAQAILANQEKKPKVVEMRSNELNALQACKLVGSMIEDVCPALNMEFASVKDTLAIASRIKATMTTDYNVDDMKYISSWIKSATLYVSRSSVAS